MTELPPLVNIFAFSSADPSEVKRMRTRMAGSDAFSRVWSPSPTWVSGIAPLPGRPPYEAERIVALEGEEHIRTLLKAAGPIRVNRLKELQGDFSFACFEDNSATFCRSAAGLVPLYLYEGNDNLAASSLYTFFPRFIGDLELDPMGHVPWALGTSVFPDGRTFFRGIRILKRGHLAREVEGRWRESEYWSPRPSSIPERTSTSHLEHANRLRELLLSNLDRDLGASGNLLSLSGGVDSSSLAAAARNIVGRPISALTHLPMDPAARAKEEFFLDNLERSVPIDRTWRIPISPEVRIRLLREAPEVVMHVLHPVLGSLPGIRRETEVTVLFGGEFADEICGSTTTKPDWNRHTSLYQLPFAMRRLPNGKGDVVDWLRYWVGRRRGRVTPPFASPSGILRADVVSEYTEWYDRRRAELLSDEGPHPHLRQRLRHADFIAMNWEACSELGIRRSVPFFTRETLELVFQCHPADLVGPGVKRLLRTALAADVPHENLHRPDRGHHPPAPAGSLPVPDLPPETWLIFRDDYDPQTRQLLPFEALFLWSFSKLIGKWRMSVDT